MLPRAHEAQRTDPFLFYSDAHMLHTCPSRARGSNVNMPPVRTITPPRALERMGR